MGTIVTKARKGLSRLTVGTLTVTVVVMALLYAESERRFKELQAQFQAHRDSVDRMVRQMRKGSGDD